MDREIPYYVAGGSGGGARPCLREEPSGLNDEAFAALSAAGALHSLLDDLEKRLFGPEPRSPEPGQAEAGGQKPPAVLASAVKGVRQRLESANGRVSRLLNRL